MKLVPAHFLPMTATMTSHLLSILHNPPGNKNGLGDESDDQDLGSELRSILHRWWSFQVVEVVQVIGDVDYTWKLLWHCSPVSNCTNTWRNGGNPWKSHGNPVNHEPMVNLATSDFRQVTQCNRPRQVSNQVPRFSSCRVQTTGTSGTYVLKSGVSEHGVSAVSPELAMLENDDEAWNSGVTSSTKPQQRSSDHTCSNHSYNLQK